MDIRLVAAAVVATTATPGAEGQEMPYCYQYYSTDEGFNDWYAIDVGIAINSEVNDVSEQPDTYQRGNDGKAARTNMWASLIIHKFEKVIVSIFNNTLYLTELQVTLCLG